MLEVYEDDRLLNAPHHVIGGLPSLVGPAPLQRQLGQQQWFDSVADASGRDLRCRGVAALLAPVSRGHNLLQVQAHGGNQAIDTFKVPLQMQRQFPAVSY